MANRSLAARLLPVGLGGRPGIMGLVNEPRDAASQQDGTTNYADQLRQQAAAFRLCAEKEGGHTTMFAGLAERGLPGAAEMVALSERAARMLGQVASVTAAQALAYDEMIEAGGPENSRAHVEYEATTRRLHALLPTDDLTD
ncbi:hypothetical protein ACQPXB_09150 [Amycolatopsis sp. CA-161197]|uniref:hypothetical protein n=1 Tax=Amycolatopsis sp. CA-161197 TaxID=3239922 RepID=UPI003D910D27